MLQSLTIALFLVLAETSPIDTIGSPIRNPTTAVATYSTTYTSQQNVLHERGDTVAAWKISVAEYQKSMLDWLATLMPAGVTGPWPSATQKVSSNPVVANKATPQPVVASAKTTFSTPAVVNALPQPAAAPAKSIDPIFGSIANAIVAPLLFAPKATSSPAAPAKSVDPVFGSVANAIVAPLFFAPKVTSTPVAIANGFVTEKGTVWGGSQLTTEFPNRVIPEDRTGQPTIQTTLLASTLYPFSSQIEGVWDGQ